MFFLCFGTHWSCVHPEDGNCNVRRNVGRTPTNEAAVTRKPIWCISSNVYYKRTWTETSRPAGWETLFNPHCCCTTDTERSGWQICVSVTRKEMMNNTC